MGLLVLLNLLLKFALVPLNQAEYTDGILQLTVFENRAGLYPPLYGALARIFSLSGLNLEWSGRAVSALAGALAVVPVYQTARRVGGEGAARFAALFFTLSPMVLRWSARVMTDALFLFLVALCLHLALEAWLSARRSAEPSHGPAPAPSPSPAPDSRRAERLLVFSTATAALAALTRYQGAFLLLPLALPLVVYIRSFRRLPWKLLLTLPLWAALPAWVFYGGFAHGGQFADRTAGSGFMTALAYWNTAESFVLIAPYYFGYPIALLALVGLFRGGPEGFGEGTVGARPSAAAEARVPFLLLHGVWAAVILAVQAPFGSFQYRYMLPLLPGLVVLAGVGAARLEAAVRFRWQRAAFSAALMASVVYLTLFSCAVLVLQRGTFGDQRAAADWVKAHVPSSVPVFSNERYGNFLKLGSVKLSFWTGRPVQYLYEPSWIAGEPPALRNLPTGSVVVLGNAYGGDENLRAVLGELSSRYRLRPLVEEPFRADVVPLLDDVMVNPMFNQNPMAWVVRYLPQRFATQVYQVEGRVGSY